MRYALIAAALVGAVAATPAWAPPAYGGESGHEGGDSWGSTSTFEQTTVVTVTSCGPEVSNCPANNPTGYPATTPPAAPPAYTPWAPEAPTSTPVAPAPPAYTPPAPSAPASSPVWSAPAPPAYGSPSAPAPSAPATSPASPAGGYSKPPVAPVPAPSAPAAPYYPGHNNGTWGAPSGTAAGSASQSEGWPVQQTGNTAAGLKAAGLLSGAGALAALLL